MHIISYIEALFFAGMFLTFISGSIGRAIIGLILGAAAVSITLLLVSRKHFTVSVKSLSWLTEHGREIEYEVTVKKNGFCFLPFIEVSLNTGSDARFRTSLLFRDSSSIKAVCKASHSGINNICVTGAQVRDFLGLLQLKVKLEGSAVAAVFPKEAPYNGPEVQPNFLPAEDDEEAEEGRRTPFGGLPGCEHREYVPGDPPRLINYKLSAKHDELLVRLEETNGTTPTTIMIAEGGAPACCDNAFALSKRLVNLGGSVKVYHKGECRAANSPETLERLREWLAFREYGGEASDEQLPAGVSVVFSGEGVAAIVR